MIGLDAAISQPRLVATTTTRDPVSPRRLRDGQAQFAKRVRQKVEPSAEYCSFLEFTTGTAKRSGGVRRPHFHSLWKGLEPEQAAEVLAVAREVWGRIAGATVHEVEEIRTPAGAAMYVASHHQKESQAPPKSWGPVRRVRPSRGYYGAPAPALREQAVHAVHDKRFRHALERAMVEADVPEDVIAEQLARPVVRGGVSVVRVREIGGRMVEVMGDAR